MTREECENKLYLTAGATPLTIADTVVREVKDKEILKDVIYYLQVYLWREYKEDIKTDITINKYLNMRDS